jgi:hypothetical protein
LFISIRAILLTLLIALTVVGAYRLEEHLRHFAGTLLGHAVGILGAAFILIIFLYPIRKYFIKIGSLKGWLNWHVFFGITGPLLIMIHGAFQFHAQVATLAFGVMVANVMSGIIGFFLYSGLIRAAKKRIDMNSKVGIAIGRKEESLMIEATSSKILKNWKFVHYPLAAIFIVVMAFHIASVLYYKGLGI